LPMLPLFTHILHHAEAQPKHKPAIVDVQTKTSYSYRHLVSDIVELRKLLLKNAGTSVEDLKETRVAFLCPNGYDYVVSQWAVWSAGGIAVPLCITHPPPELLYVLNDSQSTIVITHSDFQEKINSIACEAGIKKVIVVCNKDKKYSQYDGINFKVIVSTHANITAQVKSLGGAWRWSDKDKILHVLPLHHLHVSYTTQSCSQFRLMISGSSALPIPIRNSWKEISGGVVLLERYGMSEIGMGLSHEYEVEKRFEGCVGVPLPGVQVRLISEDNKDITMSVEQPGELQSGSYKISALEIEKELLSHPDIQEVSIVGVEDSEWGQKVGAIVVLKNQKSKLDLKQLREFAKDKLAHYKVPTLLKVVNVMPRNAMGKVNKKELVKIFED
ncbi:8102_t:CDS:2, partial [Racocetra fulgida]